MKLKTVIASAPSNIALIKYMGKQETGVNQAANPSLSLTLTHSRTMVELRVVLPAPGPSANPKFVFLPELPTGCTPDFSVPTLDEKGTAKFIAHLERCLRLLPSILERRDILIDPKWVEILNQNQIQILSANSFLTSAGVASSASSFAALTMACAALLVPDCRILEESSLKEDLARVSQQGSGSSCRSFYGPWVQWDGTRISKVESRLSDLTHFLIVVETTPKKISSSEAHRRVLGSPLWGGRVERAQNRTEEVVSLLKNFKNSTEQDSWNRLCDLSWQEFFEMHSLFHTAPDPFTYWTEGTLMFLNHLIRLKETLSRKSSEVFWPLVTMDAGANIHVIVRPRDAAFYRNQILDWIHLAKSPGYQLREDSSDFEKVSGARVL